MLSREGARGQEFNAWGLAHESARAPDHPAVHAPARGTHGFHPGIFDITFGKTNVNERVQSTLATQLALYVLIYSPVQMAADLPENYEKRPDAFQFIRDVPTDWETSRTLQGMIGDYVVVARQQRGAADWYLGATTDENAQADHPARLPRARQITKRRFIATDRCHTANPTSLVPRSVACLRPD
jgi:alpha-glucosidase